MKENFNLLNSQIHLFQKISLETIVTILDRSYSSDGPNDVPVGVGNVPVAVPVAVAVPVGGGTVPVGGGSVGGPVGGGGGSIRPSSGCTLHIAGESLYKNMYVYRIQLKIHHTYTALRP